MLCKDFISTYYDFKRHRRSYDTQSDLVLLALVHALDQNDIELKNDSIESKVLEAVKLSTKVEEINPEFLLDLCLSIFGDIDGKEKTG